MFGKIKFIFGLILGLLVGMFDSAGENTGALLDIPVGAVFHEKQNISIGCTYNAEAPTDGLVCSKIDITAPAVPAALAAGAYDDIKTTQEILLPAKFFVDHKTSHSDIADPSLAEEFGTKLSNTFDVGGNEITVEKINFNIVGDEKDVATSLKMLHNCEYGLCDKDKFNLGMVFNKAKETPVKVEINGADQHPECVMPYEEKKSGATPEEPAPGEPCPTPGESTLGGGDMPIPPDPDPDPTPDDDEQKIIENNQTAVSSIITSQNILKLVDITLSHQNDINPKNNFFIAPIAFSSSFKPKTPERFKTKQFGGVAGIKQGNDKLSILLAGGHVQGDIKFIPVIDGAKKTKQKNQHSFFFAHANYKFSDNIHVYYKTAADFATLEHADKTLNKNKQRTEYYRNEIGLTFLTSKKTRSFLIRNGVSMDRVSQGYMRGMASEDKKRYFSGRTDLYYYSGSIEAIFNDVGIFDKVNVLVEGDVQLHAKKPKLTVLPKYSIYTTIALHKQFRQKWSVSLQYTLALSKKLRTHAVSSSILYDF